MSIFQILGLVNGMKRTDMQSALITGASSGIGFECALRMCDLGWKVYAGVRKEHDAKRLLESAQGELEPVLLDVTKTDDIVKMTDLFSNSNLRLDALVNNAGIAVGGPVEALSLNEFRRIFDINFFGQIELIQAMLPFIRETKGRIVNMSSVGGKVSQPMMSAYCASKHALEALSDSLRMELRSFQVDVIVIEPGVIKTSIWDKGTAYAKTLKNTLPDKKRELYRKQLDAIEKAIYEAGKKGVSANFVADALEDALLSRKPKTRYKVGKDAKLGVWAKKWLSDRSMDNAIMRNIGL